MGRCLVFEMLYKNYYRTGKADKQAFYGILFQVSTTQSQGEFSMPKVQRGD